MKIDCSKLSNKDDLVSLIVILLSIAIMAAVILLQLSGESFLAGIITATAVCKFKQWIYAPVDGFLERHWPGQ